MGYSHYGVLSGATYFYLRNGIGQLGKFWLLQHSEPEIFIRKYLFYASQENDKKSQKISKFTKALKSKTYVRIIV